MFDRVGEWASSPGFDRGGIAAGLGGCRPRRRCRGRWRARVHARRRRLPSRPVVGSALVLISCPDRMGGARSAGPWRSCRRAARARCAGVRTGDARLGAGLGAGVSRCDRRRERSRMRARRRCSRARKHRRRRLLCRRATGAPGCRKRPARRARPKRLAERICAAPSRPTGSASWRTCSRRATAARRTSAAPSRGCKTPAGWAPISRSVRSRLAQELRRIGRPPALVPVASNPPPPPRRPRRPPRRRGVPNNLYFPSCVVDPARQHHDRRTVAAAAAPRHDRRDRCRDAAPRKPAQGAGQASAVELGQRAGAHRADAARSPAIDRTFSEDKPRSRVATRVPPAMISSPDFVTLGSAESIVTLHLIKLCVGCDSVKDLEHWIREKLRDRRKRGLSREHMHRTRMVPKRADELLDGGSLYWVIRGEVMCRQRLVDVRPFVDKDGIGRCQLVLEPKLVLVEPRPWRAVPGLALSRGQGRPARPRPRRAGRQEHAGDVAPRAARARPAVVSSPARFAAAICRRSFHRCARVTA